MPGREHKTGWAETFDGRHDYVIVGGGTAGGVLANRLSEEPEVRVLSLEARGKDHYHWIHIPLAISIASAIPASTG